MKTLQTILTITQPHCYMVNIDLIKDAYYSVKIDGDDTRFYQIFLKFKTV